MKFMFWFRKKKQAIFNAADFKKCQLENEKLKLENQNLLDENRKLKIQEYTKTKADLSFDEFEGEAIKTLSYAGRKLLEEDLIKYKKEIKENQKEILKDLVLNSILGLNFDVKIKSCIKNIDLKAYKNYNERTIGRIIGKSGKNKDWFRHVTGVDIETKYENSLYLSCYNTIKVEKARRLLERLVNSSNVTPQIIEREYLKAEEDLKNQAIKDGLEYLTKELKMVDPPTELAEKVGLLKHRFSYNQSVWVHSEEVADLCSEMAFQLGLDPLKAKRAGFFHDIGKADEGVENHVKTGVEIAKKAKLDDYIVNTIECHHEPGYPNNNYAILVKAMDKISASREGGRYNEAGFNRDREKSIMRVLLKLEWIKNVAVKNSGNKIGIVVLPEKFKYNLIETRKLEVIKALKELEVNNKSYKAHFKIDLEILYHTSFEYKN